MVGLKLDVKNVWRKKMEIKCSVCGYHDYDMKKILYKNKQTPICPDCKNIKKGLELAYGQKLGIRRIDNGD